MKASELRIGNYVNVIDQHDTVIVVESIGINYINLDYVSGIATYGGNFQNPETFGTVVPIPLTEEWMVKFGFEGSEDSCFWDDEFEAIYFKDGIFYYSAYLPAGSIEVKYIHQLQNLYFALTGKELALK